MSMDNKVEGYVTATVKIHFEHGNVACAYCPMLETYSRNQCRRTGEYLLDIRYTTGRYCPLIFKEDDNGRREDC